MSLDSIDSIHNIVFSAGAMGGIAFVGAIKALHERGLDITKIHGLSGCSIGSIIGLLYSLGYSDDELKLICTTFKYKKHADIQILEFLERCGLESGRKLMTFLSDLIYYKTGMRDITFQEHWNITGRELWINTSCITTNTPVYYSAKTSPNMSILRAVRRSISIPFLFTADEENGQKFVDGGYHDSVPAHMFDHRETLCLVIKNAGLGGIDNGFLRFCMQVTINMYTSLKMYRRNELLKKYTLIDIITDVPSMAINLSKSEKKRIIKIGYNTVKNYIKE